MTKENFDIDNWMIRTYRTENNLGRTLPEEIVSYLKSIGNGSSHLSYNGKNLYYGIHKGVMRVYEEQNIPKEVPIITEEEFREFVLGIRYIKEIKGYKVIKDIPFFLYKVGDVISSSSPIFKELHRYPEYLQPVYEEQFKVGDWAVGTSEFLKTCKNDSVREFCSRAFQVASMSKFSIFNKHGVSLDIYNARKATDEEIKKASEVKIGKYTMETTTVGAKFGCQTIPLPTIKGIQDILSRTEIEAHLTIKGEEITLDIIDKILKSFK